jgi:hypothetical protein
VTRAYAQGTSVPVSRSRDEIEQLFTRYGATKFLTGWDNENASIMCEAKGRKLRFVLPIPDPNHKMFVGSADKRASAAKAEERRRWRALVLVLKAKLEAVASGISTFDEEFLSHIVVPGGQTLGEWAIPHLAAAYERGVSMPPLLGNGEGDA